MGTLHRERERESLLSPSRSLLGLSRCHSAGAQNGICRLPTPWSCRPRARAGGRGADGNREDSSCCWKAFFPAGSADGEQRRRRITVVIGEWGH